MACTIKQNEKEKDSDEPVSACSPDIILSEMGSIHKLIFCDLVSDDCVVVLEAVESISKICSVEQHDDGNKNNNIYSTNVVTTSKENDPESIVQTILDLGGFSAIIGLLSKWYMDSKILWSYVAAYCVPFLVDII
jgi:hypothetical protein